jgi:hypothetical protein
MNRSTMKFKSLGWLTAILLAALMAGCSGGSTSITEVPVVAVLPGPSGNSGETATVPLVISSSPTHDATGAPISRIDGTRTHVLTIFSQSMNPATLVSSPTGSLLTFTLKEASGANVPGTVVMDAANTVATFMSTAAALTANTRYTATITTAATSAAGTALANPVQWSFTTSATGTAGLLPVNLGAAGRFAILSKSGVSTVPGSMVTGDIGVSPIAASAITGFSQTLDS